MYTSNASICKWSVTTSEIMCTERSRCKITSVSLGYRSGYRFVVCLIGVRVARGAHPPVKGKKVRGCQTPEEGKQAYFARRIWNRPQHAPTMASQSATVAPSAIQTALPQVSETIPSVLSCTRLRTTATRMTSMRKTTVVTIAARSDVIIVARAEPRVVPAVRRSMRRDRTNARKARPQAIGCRTRTAVRVLLIKFL
jgi:hypothetical protein